MQRDMMKTNEIYEGPLFSDEQSDTTTIVVPE